MHTVKKRTGNWCELSFFRVNAIVSCSCNPFCRLVIHFVDKSRANYVWGVVAQQKGPSIPNYFLQCTSFEIVRFIQIYTQKTGKETLLISCNTYNEKGTASITKGTSWSQTDPTSQKGERFIGRALITQKWLRSGKNRPEKIQKIHKITCNSDSILRSVKVQIQKKLYALCSTTNYKPYFMSWKVEGQGECLYDRRFAKAAELIWDVDS